MNAEEARLIQSAVPDGWVLKNNNYLSSAGNVYVYYDPEQKRYHEYHGRTAKEIYFNMRRDCRCGNCQHFYDDEKCKEHTTEDETFLEVGLCPKFKYKIKREKEITEKDGDKNAEIRKY